MVIDADTGAAAIEQLRAQIPADLIHVILHIRLTDRQAPAA